MVFEGVCMQISKINSALDYAICNSHVQAKQNSYARYPFSHSNYCDRATFAKSPQLSVLQREFLQFPKEVIKWSNEHKITPDGTYLLFMPKSYYDSKNGRYIDVYALINEYQKNLFKQNPQRYPQNSYYTREIPKGYQMKKIHGIVSVVSPENEALISQRNSHTAIVKASLVLGVASIISFALYKSLQFVKNIK